MHGSTDITNVMVQFFFFRMSQNVKEEVFVLKFHYVCFPENEYSEDQHKKIRIVPLLLLVTSKLKVKCLYSMKFQESAVLL